MSFDYNSIGGYAAGTGSLLSGVASLVSASQGKDIAKYNADASVQIAKHHSDGAVGVARWGAEGSALMAKYGVNLSEERKQNLKWVAIAAAVLILILILKK